MAKIKQDFASFKVMGFDTMGTLLDERIGIFEAFEPTAAQLSRPVEAKALQKMFNEALHRNMQKSGPSTAYRTILAGAHREVTLHLSDGQYSPTEHESLVFADGLKQWPAFPDTVEAMQCLAENSKLILVSNMDTATLEHIAEHGALKDAPIAAVIGRDKSQAFKPDHRVNHTLIDLAQSRFGVIKEHVLLVANSLTADHVPAHEMAMDSVWIDRFEGGEDAIKEAGVKPRWVFTKLSDLVDKEDRSR